jgi:ubiquinone/menaquinone biosynthesis C-methylase UbiE
MMRKACNTEPKIYSAADYYDLLATTEPDPPLLQEYMSQWDGADFFAQLKPLEGRQFLEVGIGLGRIAKQVLDAAGQVTGLDVSQKSLECTAQILEKYINTGALTLLNIPIEEFYAENQFDIGYSVLTFLHIRNKKLAVSNMIHAVKYGGKVVISLELPDKDYEAAVFIHGTERYKPEYWPNDYDEFIGTLEAMNCQVELIQDLPRKNWDGTRWQFGAPIAKKIG